MDTIVAYRQFIQEDKRCPLNIAESESYSRKVAEMLKSIRKQKGLSQKTLAEKAGISRPAVQHIEKGIRNPTLMVCHALATALGVSLSDVLAEIERGGR